MSFGRRQPSYAKSRTNSFLRLDRGILIRYSRCPLQGTPVICQPQPRFSEARHLRCFVPSKFFLIVSRRFHEWLRHRIPATSGYLGLFSGSMESIVKRRYERFRLIVTRLDASLASPNNSRIVNIDVYDRWMMTKWMINVLTLLTLEQYQRSEFVAVANFANNTVAGSLVGNWNSRYVLVLVRLVDRTNFAGRQVDWFAARGTILGTTIGSVLKLAHNTGQFRRTIVRFVISFFFHQSKQHASEFFGAVLVGRAKESQSAEEILVRVLDGFDVRVVHAAMRASINLSTDDSRSCTCLWVCVRGLSRLVDSPSCRPPRGDPYNNRLFRSADCQKIL